MKSGFHQIRNLCSTTAIEVVQMKKDSFIKKTAWCALAIGFLAFLFSSGRWNVPFTAWIWPAAFLYYSRSAQSTRGFLPLAAAIAIGNILRWLNVLDAGYAVDAVLCLLWSICWILPFIVDRLLYKHIPAWLSTLLLPGAFVTLEFLRHFTLLGSYGVTAYTQTGFLPLVQSVSLIGCFGLSFLILWFGPVLLYICEKETKWQGMLAVYLAVVSGLLLFGGVRLHTAPEASQTVKTASVIGPYYRKFNDNTYETLSYDDSLAFFVSEAERAANDGAQAACWNEEAFNIPDSAEEDFLAAAAKLARSHDMILVLPYETHDTDGSEGGLSTNKLMIIQPDGTSQSYVKTHLVPVIETSDYVKGTGAVPTVCTEKGVLSAVICFDDSYISFNHGLGAKMTEDFPDTDILFAPSWDWSSVAAAHTKSAEFRAVENGYALVKPTYDGLSAVVDRYGRELYLSGIDESGYDSVRCVDVPIAGKQTFYGRYGNVIDLTFACFGLIMVLLGIIFRSKRRADALPG